jgi:hypothetical protein
MVGSPLATVAPGAACVRLFSGTVPFEHGRVQADGVPHRPGNSLLVFTSDILWISQDL